MAYRRSLVHRVLDMQTRLLRAGIERERTEVVFIGDKLDGISAAIRSSGAAGGKGDEPGRDAGTVRGLRLYCYERLYLLNNARRESAGRYVADVDSLAKDAGQLERLLTGVEAGELREKMERVLLALPGQWRAQERSILSMEIASCLAELEQRTSAA